MAKAKKCRVDGCETLTTGIEGYCAKHRDFSINRRYTNLKSKARRLNAEFNISLYDYEQLLESGSCDYCGGKLPNKGHGLDRIDSKIGYVKENVTTCCASCNMIKSDRFSYTQMKMIAEFIQEMERTNWNKRDSVKE